MMVMLMGVLGGMNSEKKCRLWWVKLIMVMFRNIMIVIVVVMMMCDVKVKWQVS